jgi:hypothetical protein
MMTLGRGEHGVERSLPTRQSDDRHAGEGITPGRAGIRV